MINVICHSQQSYLSNVSSIGPPFLDYTNASFSGSWWWTGRPGVLWFTGWQRVRHYWATELNWTEHFLSLGHHYSMSRLLNRLLSWVPFSQALSCLSQAAHCTHSFSRIFLCRYLMQSSKSISVIFLFHEALAGPPNQRIPPSQNILVSSRKNILLVLLLVDSLSHSIYKLWASCSQNLDLSVLIYSIFLIWSPIYRQHH